MTKFSTFVAEVLPRPFNPAEDPNPKKKQYHLTNFTRGQVIYYPELCQDDEGSEFYDDIPFIFDHYGECNPAPALQENPQRRVYGWFQHWEDEGGFTEDNLTWVGELEVIA